MRVRMLTSSAGPAGNRSAGQEYDVPDAEGAALCAGKYAEPVAVVIERAEAPAEVREVAVIDVAPARPAAPKRRGR